MIIAICGKKSAGKTTLAHYLKAKLEKEGHAWEILSLAEPIKRMVAYSLGKDYAVYESEEEKSLPTLFGKTVRQLLQDLGQGVRERVHEDFWIRHWAHRARNLTGLRPNTKTSFIVDDVRYLNEFNWFAGAEAVMVRLKRNPLPVDAHASEHGLDALPDDLFNVIVPDTDDRLQAVDRVVRSHPFLNRMKSE